MPSTADLFALLQEVRQDQKDHGDKLHKIEIQTTKTNGGLIEAHRHLQAHDIEFRDLKERVDGIDRRTAPQAVVVGAEPKSPDAIRLEIPRAVWAKAGAMMGGLAVAMPSIVAWAKPIVAAWLNATLTAIGRGPATP